jgi:hypothetical protein
MTKELAHYDGGRAAIAKAVRIDEVKSISDKAIAMAVYARQAKDFELEANCVEIRRRAERRLGQMIEEMKREGQIKEGRPKKRVSEKPVNLSNQGIDKNLAQRARSMASLTDKKFEDVINDSKKKIEERGKKIVRETNGSSGPKPKPLRDINTVLVQEKLHFEKELDGKHIKCLTEIIKFKREADISRIDDLVVHIRSYIDLLEKCATQLEK